LKANSKSELNRLKELREAYKGFAVDELLLEIDEFESRFMLSQDYIDRLHLTIDEQTSVIQWLKEWQKDLTVSLHNS